MNSSVPLHAGWRFRQVGQSQWLSAKVPGCVHTDLRRHELIPDPFYARNEQEVFWVETVDWEYELEFDATELFARHEHIDLVADGLDTIATLRLNGAGLAQTDNMFVGWRFAVKDLLNPRTNRLEIQFKNPNAAIESRDARREPILSDHVGGRTQLRKQQCSFGWDWGPRLATSGIWRPIRMEGWSLNRIADFHVQQQHQKNKCEVTVDVEPQLARESPVTVRARLALGDALVAEAEESSGSTLKLAVESPALWWPNGMGQRPIYELTIEMLAEGAIIDTRTQRLGLCQIELDQSADKWGEKFQFNVNGRPVFAKGANWIPAHSFVNEGECRIPELLDSAAEAHMNMLRVWGGGIYELDSFYQGCLERGLLVWQDFMFACAIYPGDREFLDQVRREIEHQVRRLRNHAHIALWCGNNENEQIFKSAITAKRNLLRDYERVFLDSIPNTLERLCPGARYISSSEHNPHDRFGDTGNPDSGDAHFWGVWHQRQPIAAYERQFHRFFSEFGMQAYPHVETARTFTESTNLFAPEMDNHQKNGGGNQIILHYISELYRFPKDYESTVYLSQIMQAFCLRFGIEHMRRNVPRTMGALYWQLNDCWPTASWSSIDFGGRWKALHHAARRFFAPTLVSVKWIGEEVMHTSTNTVLSTVDGLEIHTVYDGVGNVDGELEWKLWALSRNEVVDEGSMPVKLKPGQAAVRRRLKLEKHVAGYGRTDLVLRSRLSADGYEDSVNTTFMTSPRNVDFPTSTIRSEVRKTSNRTFDLTLTTDALAYQIYVNLGDALAHKISDNFFDVFPGEEKCVTLEVSEPRTVGEIRKLLKVISYRDSYDD